MKTKDEYSIPTAAEVEAELASATSFVEEDAIENAVMAIYQAIRFFRKNAVVSLPQSTAELFERKGYTVDYISKDMYIISWK